MTELPIACTLSPADRQQRRATLLPSILARAVERDHLPDGYRWRFAPADDFLATLGAVIDAERHCCRFLRFAVAAESDGGVVTLEVTGPQGTREFLDQLASEAAA
jgi:hypothetical protein